mmetsp:Transcript_46941/g.109015  ORF Transcript_46941/g.109015 Transcript_46941/m.109015 type:complete len:262 (+) Transcript_46941:220-1005(+)
MTNARLMSLRARHHMWSVFLKSFVRGSSNSHSPMPTSVMQQPRTSITCRCGQWRAREMSDSSPTPVHPLAWKWRSSTQFLASDEMALSETPEHVSMYSSRSCRQPSPRARMPGSPMRSQPAKCKHCNLDAKEPRALSVASVHLEHRARYSAAKEGQRTASMITPSSPTAGHLPRLSQLSSAQRANAAMPLSVTAVPLKLSRSMRGNASAHASTAGSPSSAQPESVSELILAHELKMCARAASESCTHDERSRDVSAVSASR